MNVKTVQSDDEAGELLAQGWVIAGVTTNGWHLTLPDEQPSEAEFIVMFLEALDTEEIDRKVLAEADFGTPGGSAAVIKVIKGMLNG